MNAKKLVPTTNFHPIPSLVRNSLTCVENLATPSKPSFFSETSSCLATNVIKSYFESGLVNEARRLFDEMSHRDVVAWTSMISGYTSCSRHVQAWKFFCEMLKSEVKPNAFTLSSVLKACKGMNALSCGRLVHGMAVKLGIEGSFYVDNALLDLYATCCLDMDDAWSIFQNIDEKNTVAWTTLIAAYTHKGDGHGGLQVFRQMILEEADLDPFNVSIVVRACASIGSHTFGRVIHAAVIKHGFQSNFPVMNSLLDMYCRCDCLPEARKFFNEMTRKDLITWNTLIAGYERSDSRESLDIFSRMQSEGYTPNCFTLTSVTAACANLAVLNCGRQVHGGIIQRGLEVNLELANALIDMYAKSGDIADARKIFSYMSQKNLVSWTSMMIGYGNHGYGKEAVILFEEMVHSGIKPDRVVCMAVLSACSHAGLVDEGLAYFKLMVDYYKVSPDQDIYGCVVDLLGRAGRVEEAYQLVENMPFEPDESVWGALLGACRAHKLSNLANRAACRALDLKPKRAGTYLMLANIYAAQGKWGEYAKVRKMMKGMGNRKEAGRSWIEVKDEVYSFVVGDKTGSHVAWVYGVLEILIWHIKEEGYVPDYDCFMEDSDGRT